MTIDNFSNELTSSARVVNVTMSRQSTKVKSGLTVSAVVLSVQHILHK